MKKTWFILKHEFIATVTRKSFLVTLFLIPLVSAIISSTVSVFGKDTPEVITDILSEPTQQLTEGYVDLSGIIETIPPEITMQTFIAYPDEQSARKDLDAGVISDYYIVQSDYIQTGAVTYVRPDFNPLIGFDQSDTFNQILRYNLLGQNTELADRVAHPLELETINLNPEPQRDQNDLLTFFLPYVVTMLFYIVILSSSSLMLNSMTKEKENRIIEILINSVSPMQLLTGKIIALGFVGLLQTLVWSGTGWVLLRSSGKVLDLSAAFQLPFSILAWGVVFFLLGYTIYAGLMAGVGAMAPNLREASQITTLMVMPMILPILVLSAIINHPDGFLAVALSLFPLSSPVTMMTRLSIGGVPTWEILLSVGLLLITAYLIMRSVASLFRAQTLLSGQSFSLRRFFLGLLGKV